MAERRMFSKKITDADAFVDMSSAAQALYFHLNQGADDDGFNNQIQAAMFKAHASADDLKVLLAKRFVIQFESGVIVIKHWRMHNTLRKDRYTPTSFQEEFNRLGLKENGSYTQRLPSGCQVVAERLPQVSIGKDSIEKDSQKEVLEEKVTAKRFHTPTVEEVRAYCKERNNTVDAEKFVDFYSSKGWRVGNTPMKDWKAAVRTWEKREDKHTDAPTSKEKPRYGNFDTEDTFKKAIERTYNKNG